MSETNSFMDDQVRHVVRLFGQDTGDDDRFGIVLTPAQSVLVYWALFRMVQHVGGSVRSQVVNHDYPDVLRGHAKVAEWCHRMQKELVDHARSHGVEVSVCR